MAAIITGIVFNDINGNGILDPGESGIFGSEVVLLQPNSTCIRVTTNSSGVYTFSNLTQVGSYKIYETAISTTGCPPSQLGQPPGFTMSTTKRVEIINVTSTNITNNTTLTGSNFGHSNIAPFTCEPLGYQVAGFGSSDFSQINLVTGDVIIIANLGIQVNALGYNPVDNFMYAMDNTKNPSELIKIYQDGSLSNLGSIPNLPSNNFNNGTFDASGHYYIYDSGANRYYVVDLNPTSPNYGQLVDPTAGFIIDTSPFGTVLSNALGILDWAYSPTTGLLYGVNPNNGNVQSINPTTGQVSALSTTGTAATDYGAVFLDLNGVFYALRNNNGRVDRITISGNTATGVQFSQALASGNNDGASCINVPIEVDFGDAPDTSSGNASGNYSTLLANNGPRHLVVSGLTLGTQITGEQNALQNATATGDDIPKGIQDDGVNTPLNIDITQSSYTMAVAVTNTTGASANLYGWIDFNNDGIFQTDEGASAIVQSAPGLQVVNLVFNSIPAGTVVGTTFSRVRLTTDILVNTGGTITEDTRSIGPAGDGEVEDYQTILTDQPVTSFSVAKSVDLATALTGDTLTYTVNVLNTGSGAQNNILFTDSIPLGTTYVLNSINVDKPFSGTDLQTGITITSLAAGETAVVSWKVLIGDILPNPNPIPNIATVTAEDLTTVTSNTVNTLVQQRIVSLNAKKSVVEKFVNINDIINYTVTLENTGNVVLNKVIFKDALPSGTIYADNLNVDTAFMGTNPMSGLTITTINPGDVVNISWQIQVNGSIPIPNPIVNLATISIPGEEDIITNTVSTQVNNANLSSTKSVDKAFVEVGDTLTYSVDITNNGNVNANNVVITDVVPSGTSLVPGSINANVAFTLGNPDVKVNLINPIVADETITMTFDVNVYTTQNTNPIPNTATANYTYTVNPANPNANIATTTTNTVLTQAKNVDVSVDKSANKSTVIKGDTITYTIDVVNNGNTDLNPAILTDIIPIGTTYVNGTLLVNGAPNSSNPNTGIDVSPLNAGQSKTVIFDVIVNQNISSLPIKNTALLDYKYTIDPNQPQISKSKPSNTINVNVADISIVKSVDKEFVTVGDTLTYSTTITNTGNTPIENLIFTDIPPSNVTYVDPSLNINGLLYATLNPNNTIDLGNEIGSLFPIQPGNSITVSYRVSVDLLPQNPLITNTASVEFEYLDKTTSKTSTKNSNEVMSTVRYGELVINKSADKSVTEVGGILTYTITLQNIGNIPVESVILNDILPSETEFIKGSVIVNNMPMTNQNPNTGINVVTINAQETAVIVFSVRVLSLPPLGEITNSASVNYKIPVDPTTEPITQNKISNTIVTGVKKVELSVTKSVDKDKAIVGDEITYTFTIVNTGTVDSTNIKFFDLLPSEVDFVDGSFVGSTQASVVASDLITGVDVGSLIAGSQKNISFKVILNKRPIPPVVNNIANIIYEYELVPGQTLSKGSSSNETSINVLSIIFKQDSIDGNFIIPCQKPDIESILEFDVNPIVTSVELVNSPKGISQEGQILTGKKLVVCIKFCLKVMYVSRTCEQSVHSAHKEISICSYAVVPEDIDINVCSKPNIIIEDLYYLELNSRKLFFNITYLLDTGL